MLQLPCWRKTTGMSVATVGCHGPAGLRKKWDTQKGLIEFNVPSLKVGTIALEHVSHVRKDGVKFLAGCKRQKKGR